MLVERNQIDFTFQRPQKLDQLPGVLQRIVDSVNKQIFHSNTLAVRQRIVFQHRQKSRQRIRPVYRHQVTSRFRICSIQRNRQVDRKIPAELLQLRNQTGGRQGHPAMRKVIAIRVENDRQGLYDCLIIRQRLSHSHENDINETPAVIQITQHCVDLVHNLRSREISLQTDRSGAAEPAFESAPKLCRNAHGVMIPHRHQNAFHTAIFFQWKQILSTSVRADEDTFRDQARNESNAVQLIAQALGQISHTVNA